MIWIFLSILMVALDVPGWIYIPFVIAVILDFVFAILGRK